MTIEELGVRLEELKATRATASDELEAVCLRSEGLKGLEQGRDALMEFYSGAVPEELERLEPEERNRVYGMLRFEVLARPDGTLEARGILSERFRATHDNGRAVCESELASWRIPRTANRTGLTFRAVV